MRVRIPEPVIHILDALRLVFQLNINYFSRIQGRLKKSIKYKTRLAKMDSDFPGQPLGFFSSREIVYSAIWTASACSRATISKRPSRSDRLRGTVPELPSQNDCFRATVPRPRATVSEQPSQSDRPRATFVSYIFFNMT